MPLFKLSALETTVASTPYKRWSKCSVEKVRGKVFAAFFRKLRGKL